MSKVYFIKAGDSIKIGVSVDIPRRMSELRVGCAHKLELIATIDGSYAEESRLHAALDQHRLRGEWFSDCEEVRDVISHALSYGVASLQPKPRQFYLDDSESQLRPIMIRINGVMTRYLGENVTTSLAQETAADLPQGSIVNNVIGGIYSDDRAIVAISMIKQAISDLEPFVTRSTDPAIIPETSLIALNLETGLQRLFSA
jgi:hypothetical protein